MRDNRVKIICLIAILLIKINVVNAQLDSARTKEYIYNEVYKNIAAYFIKYEIGRRSGMTKDGFLKQGLNTYFFDRCLPDNEYELACEIVKLNWKYPIDGYTLYQVKLNGFKFESRSGGQTKSFPIIDGSINAPPGNYYLLGINQRNQIKFISGKYLVHDVSGDFQLDKTNPSSFIEYIKYKAFDLRLGKISFTKKKAKHLYYSAYSDEFGHELTIIINPESPATLNVVF